MATRKSSRYVMKENKIPLGKKKENLDKTAGIKKTEELGDIQMIQKKRSSLTNKKANKTNESKQLKVINLNVAPTDTSLDKAVKNPRTKLSTIKELKELEDRAIRSMNVNAKTVSTSVQTGSEITNDTFLSLSKSEKILKKDSKKLVENVQKENDLEDLNNTVDELNIKPQIPEVVLSPYVCTTRGQKWKPSPRKPPKLSELFDKYDEDNVADTYRKKLDEKTIELQSKVKYWSELAAENHSDIPQSIKDDIDVACGQTKLLTTDKFMQMRSLIDEFENNSGTMPIKMDDLDGFWDMLLLQVAKLEGHFNQLSILKENNWAPLEPIAKKVISKVSKVNKASAAKSKFADFLKSQKMKEKKKSPNTENSDSKNSSNNSKFNEMKMANNFCLISSTPTSSDQKTVSFTPMLIKTMELSYVARRSGMTPLILAEPHVSPLKPTLKNPGQQKGVKRKNIQFASPAKSNGFVTPENSYENENHKIIQSRIPTPHTLKVPKAKLNPVVISQNNAKDAENNDKLATKVKKTVMEIEESVKNESVRRSSRLASKPSKNYKF